jgi:hypothetical protein
MDLKELKNCSTDELFQVLEEIDSETIPNHSTARWLCEQIFKSSKASNFVSLAVLIAMELKDRYFSE